LESGFTAIKYKASFSSRRPANDTTTPEGKPLAKVCGKVLDGRQERVGADVVTPKNQKSNTKVHLTTKRQTQAKPGTALLDKQSPSTDRSGSPLRVGVVTGSTFNGKSVGKHTKYTPSLSQRQESQPIKQSATQTHRTMIEQKGQLKSEVGGLKSSSTTTHSTNRSQTCEPKAHMKYTKPTHNHQSGVGEYELVNGRKGGNTCPAHRSKKSERVQHKTTTLTHTPYPNLKRDHSLIADCNSSNQKHLGVPKKPKTLGNTSTKKIINRSLTGAHSAPHVGKGGKWDFDLWLTATFGNQLNKIRKFDLVGRFNRLLYGQNAPKTNTTPAVRATSSGAHERPRLPQPARG